MNAETPDMRSHSFMRIEMDENYKHNIFIFFAPAVFRGHRNVLILFFMVDIWTFMWQKHTTQTVDEGAVGWPGALCAVWYFRRENRQCDGNIGFYDALDVRISTERRCDGYALVAFTGDSFKIWNSILVPDMPYFSAKSLMQQQKKWWVASTSEILYILAG